MKIDSREITREALYQLVRENIVTILAWANAYVEHIDPLKDGCLQKVASTSK